MDDAQIDEAAELEAQLQAMRVCPTHCTRRVVDQLADLTPSQEADSDMDMDMASPVVGTTRISSQFTGAAAAEADAERSLLQRLHLCADALPDALPGTGDDAVEQLGEPPGDVEQEDDATAAQGRQSTGDSVFSPRFSHWAHLLAGPRAARVTQLSAVPAPGTWDAAPAGLPRRSTPGEQRGGEPGEPPGRVSAGESPWWKYAFGSEAAQSDGEGDGSTTGEVEGGRASGDAAAVDDVTASVESLARRLSAVIAASAAARAAELAASTAAAVASLRQRQAARTLVRAAKSCPFLVAYHTRRQGAAVVVQAHVRGLLARRASQRAAAEAKARAGADLRARVKGQLTAAEQVKRREAAACVVQRHARRWIACRKAASLRAQAAHSALVRVSAVAIQRMVRGHLVRCRLTRAMRAVAELEAALEVTDLEGDGTVSDNRHHELGASVETAPLPVEDEFPEIDVASVWTQPAFDLPGALGARLSASSDGARSRRSSSAAGAASLAADEGREQSSQQTKEEKHREALERSKAAWGFTTMDVAERYLAAASRHRAFLNRQAAHQKWERDPQARLDHVLRKRPGSTSPAKRHGVAASAADAATASSAARMALAHKAGHQGGERSLAAEVKAAARCGRTNAGGSPVRSVPTVNL
jgi:hypothetical protein